MPIVAGSSERVAEIRLTKEEEERVKQITPDDFFNAVEDPGRRILYNYEEARKNDSEKGGAGEA